MKNVPREVAGFVALPLCLPKTAAFSSPAKHYLYIKPHDMSEADAARSLFISNLPMTTTEAHIQHLFGQQLAAGRVDRVVFDDGPTRTPSQMERTGKKRKRMTAAEIDIELEAHKLPQTLERPLGSSGAHAVVVFLDRSSADASLKAARHAAKAGTEIVWGEGIAVPPLGLQRYRDDQKLRYPARKDLLQSVDSYMSAYGRMEEARSRAEAKRREVPDEDGFVTVTRGARGGVIRSEDSKGLLEKQNAKSKGVEDFYRFQMRERRKEEQGEFLRKFEQDRRRVDEMRARRGKIRASLTLGTVEIFTNMS